MQKKLRWKQLEKRYEMPGVLPITLLTQGDNTLSAPTPGARIRQWLCEKDRVIFKAEVITLPGITQFVQHTATGILRQAVILWFKRQMSLCDNLMRQSMQYFTQQFQSLAMQPNEVPHGK